MSDAEFEPRKRRAAAKPAVRDLSDSEDDVPKKRSRKRAGSEDEDYREPVEESAKRPRAKAPPKPKAARAPARQRKHSKDESGEDGPERKRHLSRTEDFGEASQHKQAEADHLESFNFNDEEKDVGLREDSSRFDHETGPGPLPSTSYVEMAWNESDLLAQNEGLDNWVARNLVKLFEGDNTIPFIARYRKEMTGNMEPEQLRHAKETFEEIKVIQHKASTMIKNIEKLGKLTPSVRRSIVCAKSLPELDLINTPFKAGSKRTLAERARLLGLDQAAQTILEGTDYISLSHFIDRDKDGLKDSNEVQLGIQHILADIISKDRGVLDFITDLKKTANIRLESSRAKGTVTKELAKGGSKAKSDAKGKPLSAAEKKKLQAKADEESKYRNYFEFGMNVKYIKPHQVLAINRGEAQKELSVRLVVPEFFLDKLILFCNRQWLSKGVQYDLRTTIFNDSVKDSYNRLIQPLIVRQVRTELNQNAERASIEVFAVNLKKLLLMPPFRGRVVLGIDPGFRNGCKVALINLAGDVLEKGVFNLNCGKRTWDLREDPNALWLRKIMARHRCEVIALGNGTACRETEEYLSELFQMDFFKPLDVSYTIVSEQGASIYSCSSEAKAEFPDLDPNLISAVSIARRLQDPLAELVKVEPKHLGVGMYQHDLSEKKLSSTLDEIVVECVSFVGVDLNTAPHCLLRRVAGLNSSRADKILEYRKKNGPFLTREDVKKVRGIGEKSFEQCAGFIRIIPETIDLENAACKCNPLDMTWIHPESYDCANRFLSYCHVKAETIGTPESIRAIAKAINTSGGIKSLAEKLDSNEALVKLISDGLQMPRNHDFRSEFEKPLFRKGLTSINELQSGDILTGRITNTTHFGAFVDIGVGQNGLIHNSGMGGKNPQFGDRVQVKVLNVELSRQRIGLQLLAIL
ncbi:S1 RNA-binding domain-containing protein 1 [Frankliniella fusca]|uniref:S1 RNA-binding domain-containing protein 1 n=1 Tax=Frankliniella fusca TaxID=407009 RepID=A0AAE1GZX3_9NEOP|nr:S1 RNA-binding domain-containing protein 1 [Frankliniella fusca]